jgi:hypothetical protein
VTYLNCVLVCPLYNRNAHFSDSRLHIDYITNIDYIILEEKLNDFNALPG